MGFIGLDQFAEFRRLEKHYEAIHQEVAHIDAWVNWRSDDSDVGGHCRFLSGDWKVFPAYVRTGMSPDALLDSRTSNTYWWKLLFAQLPKTFPETTAVLRHIPRVRWAGFSRLGARSKLAPHSHVSPDSLICHLGVVIPPDGTCGLMVDGETHIWHSAGETVIFDDNYIHSAWNDSDSDRIVLYMNFARG